MHHLNVRVAWHDNKWDGSVCRNPSGNAFCVDLDRIRAERNDGLEDRLARKWFAYLTPDQLPPCTAEAGAFMNSRKFEAFGLTPGDPLTHRSRTDASGGGDEAHRQFGRRARGRPVRLDSPGWTTC